MPRTKGSPNKPKKNKIELIKQPNGSYIIKVNLEKQVENTPIIRDSRRGWVNWGIKNMYPLDLSSLYYNSPTHKACVDFEVASILGDGVDYAAMQTDETILFPNYKENWDQFLQKICLDYSIYGSYSFQIIKNRDDKTYSFFHEPITNVRCAPMDDDGNIPKYYLSADWSATAKYQPVEIESFGFDDKKLSIGKPYLFVYNRYSPDIMYYGLPQYASAIKAIQTEIELVRYDLRSVLNNFTASGILTMNRIDDDEERKSVLSNIEAMFTGSDSANSLMITFKNNNEDTPVTFTKIDKDVNNVNLFDSANARLIDRIVESHRIPSKALIGLNVDSAMLGGEGNLINVAYNLYLKTKGINDRNAITGTINKMLSLNGIDQKIILKPLSFSLLDNKPNELGNTVQTEQIEKTDKITSNENMLN